MAFNENSFWRQFETSPVGTIFKHPRDGYIMKTGVGTRRSGWNPRELNTQLARELHRRWAPNRF